MLAARRRSLKDETSCPKDRLQSTRSTQVRNRRLKPSPNPPSRPSSRARTPGLPSMLFGIAEMWTTAFGEWRLHNLEFETKLPLVKTSCWGSLPQDLFCCGWDWRPLASWRVGPRTSPGFNAVRRAHPTKRWINTTQRWDLSFVYSTKEIPSSEMRGRGSSHGVSFQGALILMDPVAGYSQMG